MKESSTQTLIRLDAAQHGLEAWRNNTGVLLNQNGVPVRYGLANDSASLNKTTKSSDLIGIRPITITPEMVGKTIGVFMAVETKRPGWVYSPTDPHSFAQNNFHDIVRRAGGLAGFATNVQEFRRIALL